MASNVAGRGIGLIASFLGGPLLIAPNLGGPDLS